MPRRREPRLEAEEKGMEGCFVAGGAYESLDDTISESQYGLSMLIRRHHDATVTEYCGHFIGHTTNNKESAGLPMNDVVKLFRSGLAHC